MSVRISLDPVAGLDDRAIDALRALTRAVYPPEIAAGWPGRHLVWSAAEWAVRVDDEGELVSYAGLVLRHGRLDGSGVLIGGIGGVKTHPDHRGRGHAESSMTHAVDFFRDNRVDFGLLVCETGLIPYYGRQGWRTFEGELWTIQKDEEVRFTFNRVMTRSINLGGPVGGVIHLDGPPW